MRSKEFATSQAGVDGQARRNGINGTCDGGRVYAGNSLPDRIAREALASLPLLAVFEKSEKMPDGKSMINTRMCCIIRGYFSFVHKVGRLKQPMIQMSRIKRGRAPFFKIVQIDFLA